MQFGLNLLVYTAAFSIDQIDLIKKVADMGYDGAAKKNVVVWIGDYDGITVVPRDSIDKIYPLCLKYFDTEKNQRTALKQGMRLSQFKEDIL